MDEKSLEFTKPFQLTKTIRREPYEALLSTKSNGSATGKIILITGGGSGIGAAAARVWTEAGAEGVIVTGRRPDKLEETASEVRTLNGGKTKVLTVQADIAKDQDVANLFAQVLETFGRAPDVVLANAGAVKTVPIGEHTTDDWWDIVSTNLKGVYATAHHFIKWQSNPKEPTGTFITTNSGLAGLIVSGMSAYSISKLATQRFIEYLDTEYPTLRSFVLLPGIVPTAMLASNEPFVQFGKDHVDLTGLFALYLATTEANYLKGGLTSVNWDIEEMASHKNRIVGDNMLKLKWVPILPASGGKGL